MFQEFDDNLNLYIMQFLNIDALKKYKEVNVSGRNLYQIFVKTPTLITPLLIENKGKLGTFHYALAQNKPDIIYELLKMTSPTVYTKATHYAICKAASQGNLELLIHLITYLEPSTETINHALLTGAESDKSEVTSYLLSIGGDCNYANAFGTRPIEAAIARNNIVILEQLINVKVNIHYDNEFPIRLASSFDHTTIALKLLEYGALLNIGIDAPLILAIENLNISLVKVYLEKGADVHVREDSPIRKVAWIGHLPLFDLLVQYGADLETGLKIAKYRKHDHITKNFY